jgi:hypothetical protein
VSDCQERERAAEQARGAAPPTSTIQLHSHMPAPTLATVRPSEPSAMGWLLWNTTRLLALLAIVFFASLLALFVWLALDGGFAWLAIALGAVALALLISAVRKRPAAFDIRR